MEYYSIFRTPKSPEEFMIYGRVNKKFTPQVRTRGNGESFTSYGISLHVNNGAEWAKKYRKNFTPPTDSKNLLFPINVPENVYKSLKVGDCILVFGEIEKYITKEGKESLKINFKHYRNNNIAIEQSDSFGEVQEDTSSVPFLKDEDILVEDNKKQANAEIVNNENVIKQTTQTRNPRGKRTSSYFENVVINKAL